MRAVLVLTLAACGAAVIADGPALRFEEIAETADVQTVHHRRTFKGPAADVLGMFTAGGAAVAVADYDNDGLDDLFVTNSEVDSRCHLFHNDRGFHFTHVTERAGVGGGDDPKSIVADALWFDYGN